MSVTKSVKLTLKELNEKLKLIELNISVEPNDELSYLIKKLFKKSTQAAKDLTEKYHEDLQDLFVKYASVDDNGILLLDGDKYRYSTENQIRMNEQARKLRKELEQKEVDVEVTFADKSAPRLKDLDMFIKEELGGFLFEA